MYWVVITVIGLFFNVVADAQPYDNYATWVPVSYSPNSAVLPLACNPDIIELSQLAKQRISQAVPALVPSTSDTLFALYGGYTTVGDFYFTYQNIHLVRILGESETEIFQLVDSETDPGAPPQRDGAEFRELSTGDILTVYGYDGTTYLTGIFVFNTSSLTWITVQPDGTPAGVTTPIGRAWYQLKQIQPLVRAPNTDYFMLLGGEGDLDPVLRLEEEQGQAYLANDQSLDDSWLLTISWDAIGYHASWMSLTNDACEIGVEHCDDAQLVADQFAAVRNVQANFTMAISTRVRPNDWNATLEELMESASTIASFLSSIRGTHAQLDDLGTVNDDSTCTTVCSKSTRAVDYPPKRDGLRMVVYGNTVYQFGGYSCLVNGAYGFGGPVCFENSVYLYHIYNNTWTALRQADASPEQQQLWPSGRSYHIWQLHNNKIWLMQGAYIDEIAVYTYFDDVSVFNADTLLWETVSARGSSPPGRWDVTYALHDDSMWYLFGCQSGVQYNDSWVLLIDRAITYTNLQAFGLGLTNATAGVAQSFYLQTRSAQQGPGNSVTFGGVLDWGVGLTDDFEVNLISTRTVIPGLDISFNVLPNSISFVYEKGAIIEIGQGLYEVSYSPTLGSVFQIFISFQGHDIPGSPFSMFMQPSPIVSPAYTVSLDTPAAVRGTRSSIWVRAGDLYGNAFLTGGLTSNFSMFLSVGATPAAHPAPLAFDIVDFDNGTYELSYDAPTDDVFYVFVRLNAADIAGSPYLIESISEVGVTLAARTAMRVIAAICVFILFVLVILILVFRATPAVRVGTPLFMIFMLVGGMLCLMSIFALAAETDIGCRAFPFLLGVGFVLMLGSLYIKTYRLWVIFRQKNMKVINFSLLRMSAALFFLSAIEIGFNIAWIVVSPASIHSVAGTPAPRTYPTCDGDRYTIWAGVSLIDKALFLVYGIFLAVGVRGIPSAYNESTWIGISIYNVALFAIIVFPVVYAGSTQETLTAVFVLTCVAIIWVVMAACVMVVATKLYFHFKGIDPDKRYLTDDLGLQNHSTLGPKQNTQSQVSDPLHSVIDDSPPNSGGGPRGSSNNGPVKQSSSSNLQMTIITTVPEGV